MAFVIENGSGVANANAYVTEAFVTTYLTDRNRQEENGWDGLGSPEKQAAIIAATDYIETRWRHMFKGDRLFGLLFLAKGTLVFTQNPVATETVVIGSITYTFQTVLASANDVLIGADTETSIAYLVAAITGGTGEGTLYGTGTVAHTDVSAFEYDGDSLVAHAINSGLAGNLVTTTTTVTSATWSNVTLTGGSDVGKPQPLSFPRKNLRDDRGTTVAGVPERLKFAVSEYAIRAVSNLLQPDLVTDETGAQLLRQFEKVGPIEQDNWYQEHGRISSIKPYPIADLLLKDFVEGGSSVMRA